MALLGYIFIIATFMLFINLYGSGREVNGIGELEVTILSYLPVILAKTLFYAGIGWLIVKFSFRYLKHGSWPPPGFPVPFRTRVTYLKHPVAVKFSVFLVLLLLVLNIGTVYYSWFTMYQLSQSM
ncbi:MAG: hypothetical protein KME65_00045 [Candidatus Thiodiazotropha sp. (ex Ctena orbiculata)]|uniref:Uncharacterized protein n=1 Tax=Candidatus Thiodiazotropha taylori TaxID=2792791 RepID=A0A944M595_9GAMM|nr:hypothetical protein [Candidatus Thiodiazotropha taylori]MBV2138428.1 hypothetical protein [Candidatus Thiodiazotropha taylori]